MTGKDIIVVLSLNNSVLASTFVRSQDIQTDADMIERASATQQAWREYIAGRKGWTLTVNYLLLTAAKVTDLLYAGQTFDITVKNVGDTHSVTGKAIMKSVKQTATVGNLAQGSFVFQGTGALTPHVPT